MNAFQKGNLNTIRKKRHADFMQLHNLLNYIVF